MLLERFAVATGRQTGEAPHLRIEEAVLAAARRDHPFVEIKKHHPVETHPPGLQHPHHRHTPSPHIVQAQLLERLRPQMQPLRRREPLPTEEPLESVQQRRQLLPQGRRLLQPIEQSRRRQLRHSQRFDPGEKLLQPRHRGRGESLQTLPVHPQRFQKIETFALPALPVLPQRPQHRRAAHTAVGEALSDVEIVQTVVECDDFAHRLIGQDQGDPLRSDAALHHPLDLRQRRRHLIVALLHRPDSGPHGKRTRLESGELFAVQIDQQLPLLLGQIDPHLPQPFQDFSVEAGGAQADPTLLLGRHPLQKLQLEAAGIPLQMQLHPLEAPQKSPVEPVLLGQKDPVGEALALENLPVVFPQSLQYADVLGKLRVGVGPRQLLHRHLLQRQLLEKAEKIPAGAEKADQFPPGFEPFELREIGRLPQVEDPLHRIDHPLPGDQDQPPFEVVHPQHPRQKSLFAKPLLQRVTDRPGAGIDDQIRCGIRH